MSRAARCLALACFVAAVGLLTGVAAGHGFFEKVFWGGRANYTTRGSLPPTSNAARLYYVQAPEFLTGKHDAVGWRVKLQDEDASTAEPVEFAFVKLTSKGLPDTTSAGEIYKLRAMLFGRGQKGTIAFDFLVTFGIPQAMPSNIGLRLDLPANSNWPKDGITVHGQLNIPTDSRRPRVPPPYDKQVFVYEVDKNKRLAPLGGRTLDTIFFGSLFTEPTMAVEIRTKAYGLGFVRSGGVDAHYPLASRGDELGLWLDGGQVGADGWGLVMVARSLAKTPLRLPRGEWLLNLAETQLLHLTQLDSLGQQRTNTIPFKDFPKGARDFWLQSIIYNPWSGEFEVTDAVQVRGQ